MSNDIAAVFLAIAVVMAVLSVLGVGLMRRAEDQLHYLVPVSVLSAAAMVAAMVSVEVFDARTLKTMLVFAVLAVLNPVLVHATARAARARDDEQARLQ
ncbi:MAG: monovalent cation/H(+) antiporter subunit G [Actinobacteria bacterium]|nr:monovalent cation/H(+) antiporter subunit G [Actinomycetota bacterium]